MGGPVPELRDRARACAERLHDAESVLLASHIDADGLTSAAVATTALERAAIPFETTFCDQLDDAELAAIAATDHDTVLLTDFGSGQLESVVAHEEAGDFTPVVVDHHQPADAETEYHLNPLLEGIDGASELSGAGAAYLVARELATTTDHGPPPGPAAADGGAVAGDGATAADGDDGATAADDAAAADAGTTSDDPPTLAGDPGNRDLAALAVVGAVGDMQASDGELTGANAAIVEEGVAVGVLDTGADLTLYGTQTRPLPKLLEYASDVQIPGVTNDEAGAVRFLEDLGLDLKADGDWRRWVDLSADEKRTLASGLVRRAVERGVPAEKVDSLVGTTYTLAREAEGTELRDASEFSTLLNATARYDRADVGLAVCLGDRDEALTRARRLLSEHRRNLSAGVEWVERTGVTREEHLQWFHAGGEIRATIVGIVAGMAVGCDGVDRGRPIVAFADKDDERGRSGSTSDDDHAEVKVSARGTQSLVRRGLDLSVVMGEAARAVGGEGGGHDVAAGATVPTGTEAEFVARADEVVGEQLG